MRIKCPECGEMKRRIGLAGHLVLKHGYGIKEANEALAKLEKSA